MCRDGDVAARTGGEEFVVLLINTTGAKALEFAEQLRSRIETSQPAGLDITVSIGVAEDGGRHDCTFGSLFKAADAALYQAKEGGRNR
ncbi:GGDEF domain-containing protein, partial [Arthrospira platensis SPKY2]